MSINKTTRKFFPYLQTLHLYHIDDLDFEDDEKMIKRIYHYLVGNLEPKEMKQIHQWTNMKCDKAVFDSNKDDWSIGTSVFDDRIMNKSNLLYVIEDEENNKFGFFSPLPVTGIAKYTKNTGSFFFSLKSNGRITQGNGMMKFEARKTPVNPYFPSLPFVRGEMIRPGMRDSNENNALEVFNKSYECLFGIYTGFWIMKENKKSESYLYHDATNFDYHGIPNALIGRNTNNQTYFTPKRIVVIQMK